MSFVFIGPNPNLTPEVHHPVKGEWAGFSDFSRLKQKNVFIGSKLTISLTVATILVTKPFIHAGLIRRDKEMVKFLLLYQQLTTIAAALVKKLVKFFWLPCSIRPAVNI